MTHANPAHAAGRGADLAGSEPVEPEAGPHPWTLFAVFRVSSSHAQVLDGRDVASVVRELEDVVGEIAEEQVQVRGWYDVSGLRTDADVMVWLLGAAAEDLQWALRQLRRTALLRPLIRVWSGLGVHRSSGPDGVPAPGFAPGAEPRPWLSVHPFVRSLDWYLLDPAERARMLEEYRRVTTEFPEVVMSTVAALGLGDAEWLLSMEAEELTDLVEMARALRAVDARGHVRAERPVFAGRRIEPVELIEVLQ